MSEMFEWKVRVYYEDTDAGGIVFYANYLKFFERARTEWLRALEIHQQQLKQEQQAMFVVKSASVDYHAPARLDDELRLSLLVEKLGKASVQFLQQAWCGSSLLAEARVKVGCVHSEQLRPLAIPEFVRIKMSAINNGL